MKEESGENELYIELYGRFSLSLLSPIYTYISYIKFNVVTLYKRILTCFIIYRNAILGEGEKEGEGGVETRQ